MKADGDTPGIDQAAPRPLSRAYRRISRVLPELGRFKSDEERKTALERADAEVLKSSGFRRGMVVATVAFAALIVVVFVLLLWFPFLLGTALSTVSLGALFGVTCAWYCRKAVRRSLRRQLAEQGVPICVRCAYDLRGQIEPRCPECGTAFDEKLLESQQVNSHP